MQNKYENSDNRNSNDIIIQNITNNVQYKIFSVTDNALPVTADRQVKRLDPKF